MTCLAKPRLATPNESCRRTPADDGAEPCRASPCHDLPCRALPMKSCRQFPAGDGASPCRSLPSLASPCLAVPSLAKPCLARPCHAKFESCWRTSGFHFVGITVAVCSLYYFLSSPRLTRYSTPFSVIQFQPYPCCANPDLISSSRSDLLIRSPSHVHVVSCLSCSMRVIVFSLVNSASVA
jgi:hypothetical protein